jgi:glycosyltransferase involved in cell wall biosynthesis
VKTLYIAYFGALKHLSHSQILPYLRELAAAGVEVTLLSFEELGPDAEQEKRAIAELRRNLQAAGIDWRWLRYHKRPSVPATAFDVVVGTAFAGYLVLRKGIDVVHARGHVPGLIGLALDRLLPVKLLFDLRGLMGEEYVEAGRWPAGGAAFRAVKWVENKLFERADAIVMLTRAAVRTMKQTSPQMERSAAHVEVIPCCVDLRKFRPVDRSASHRSRLGLEGKRVMVYVGSTGGWYMSEELARLFAVGRAQQPNLHFLVLTQSPHEEMRQLLKAEGLPDDSFTIATAPSAEMPAYLASADFGVHFIRPGTAMIANSPTKFAEYLASGLPILTNTGIGDSDEILREEGVGTILPEFSPAAYQAGLAEIGRLLADPELPGRCRQVAARRFDLRTVGRQGYSRVYQALGWTGPRAEGLESYK